MDLALDAAALDGTVWTDCKALGPKSAQRLAVELGKLSIELDASKDWTFWRRGGEKFIASDLEAPAVADAIVAAVAKAL